MSYRYNTNIGYRAVIEGAFQSETNTYIEASGKQSHAEGGGTTASGTYSHAEGEESIASGRSSHAEGGCTTAQNGWEHASGVFNNSTLTNTIFGNAGNTLFSVGNGSSTYKHNALEIRQNGDIYYSDTEKINGSTVHYYDAPTRKLQDAMVTSTTNGLKIEVVNVLPQNPSNDTIYIIQ